MCVCSFIPICYVSNDCVVILQHLPEYVAKVYMYIHVCTCIYNVKCTCKFTPPKTDHIHAPLYHLGSSTVLEYLYLLAGMGQVHRKVFKYKYKYMEIPSSASTNTCVMILLYLNTSTLYLQMYLSTSTSTCICFSKTLLTPTLYIIIHCFFKMNSTIIDTCDSVIQPYQSPDDS